MNKKTKMYVGLAIVAVAAYYFYMQSKKKETTTSNLVGFDANRDYYAKKREKGVSNIKRRK
jgi:hypothetical protein